MHERSRVYVMASRLAVWLPIFASHLTCASTLAVGKAELNTSHTRSQNHASKGPFAHLASTLRQEFEGSGNHPRKSRLLNHHKRRHHETSVQHVQRVVASGDDLGFPETSSFLSSPQTIVRPGAGGDSPEVVKFGMFGKDFYGADLKSNTFRIDIVISLKWQDERVAKWLPKGLERLVLSDSQAGSKIWIPDVVVTNHELGGMQVVSTSVEIFKDGTVEKVERAQVRASNRFKLQGYPFDDQTLQIKIASSKYMANDVVFEPMEKSKSIGINEDKFSSGSYHVKSWRQTVGTEADGDLVKSRGMMEITVSRNLAKYYQDHLVPTSIVLVISWAVFYFPFAAQFITPRLMLSIITLLTFVTLMVKSAAQLPGAAPFNWNDLFNQLVQSLMFITVVLNIFSEICHHHFKVEILAQAVNHEAKVLLPIMSILGIAIIMVTGKYGLLYLETATFLTQLLVIVTLVVYGSFTFKRFVAEQRTSLQRKELERQKTQKGFIDDGAAAGGAGF